MDEPPDASLVKNWLTGRSIARGLPAPVDDHGGWRVETGQRTEMRRYVFTEASAELQELAYATTNPQVVLKLCGSVAAMQAVLPPRWRVLEGGYFMTIIGAANARPAVPPGYECEIEREEALITARIVTPKGELAASGFGASVNGVFVYDRISTEPPHRRRGLGSVIMNLLGKEANQTTTQHALVATEEGRFLYTKLGWAVRSPWTTALISVNEEAA